MTRNKYAAFLLISFLLIAGGHYFLDTIYHWNKQIDVVYKIDGYVFALYLISIPIMWKELESRTERFVLKFMVVTTLQILGVLGMMAFVTYSRAPGSRNAIIQLLAVFVVMLIVQSTLLIRSRKG